MKRDIAHAKTFQQKAATNPLTKKQLERASALPPKEWASEAVRLGRLQGLYFSENDWLELNPVVALKKAA